MSELSNRLSFMAIPDAAHFLDEDYAFLTFKFDSSIYYGVTCFRQIGAEAVPSEEPSRHWVQKAVCVISRTPLFTLILNRLHPTTHAYFNQGDFHDRTVFYFY